MAPPDEPIVVDAPDAGEDILDAPGYPREPLPPRPGYPAAGRPGPDRRPYRGGGRPPDRGPRYTPRPPAPIDPSIALGEDEELVAGRRPVEEAFVARREAHRLLVVPQRRQALEKLVLHATSLRIPVVEVEGGTLTSVAGFDGHQGIALVVAPRRWASPDDVLAQAAERGEPPLVLVLDSLEDPQNVGTLLRTAEATGAHGAVFPTRHQAPLTPAAVKASAGAVEHLRLAPVDDLPGALADLHARGLRIVGADGDAPLTARDADLRGPIAIVVGSEGKGLGSAVRRRCDLLVRIPMHGRIDSLNAAVAGSILLYEAAAQRRLPEPARTLKAMDPGDAGDDDVADVPADAPAEPAAPEPATAEARAVAEPETEMKARSKAREAKPKKAKAATAEAPTTKEPPARKAKAKAKPKRAKAEPATEGPEAVATEPPPEAPAKPATSKRTRAAKAATAPDATADTPPDDADDLLPGGPPVDPPTPSGSPPEV